MYRFEGGEPIKQLVRMDIIKNRAKAVSLMTLDGVKKLCRHLITRGRAAAGEALLSQIRDIIKTSNGPPPIRYQPGLYRREEHVPDRLQHMPQSQDQQPQPQYEMHDHFRVQPVLSRQYHFPSAPPEVILLPSQQQAPYALSIVPKHTQAEINQFMAWSAAPINTTRSFTSVPILDILPCVYYSESYVYICVHVLYVYLMIG